MQLRRLHKTLSLCFIHYFFFFYQRLSGRPLDPGRKSTEYDLEMGEGPRRSSTASNHHYKMKGTGLAPEEIRPSIRIANIPKELEIPREKLKFLGQVLGKGNFGKVEKAIQLKEDGTENVVAVKMIKGMKMRTSQHFYIFLCKKMRFWKAFLEKKTIEKTDSLK